MAQGEKRSAGAIGPKRRARFSHIARRVASAFDLETVLCAVRDDAGSLHFVASSRSGGKLPDPVELASWPELAGALASGRAAVLDEQLASDLGGTGGVVLPFTLPGGDRGFCVVLDPASALSGVSEIERLSERSSAMIRLVAEAEESAARVKELERTAGAFRALVEASSDPVMLLDLDGRVRVWNPACEGLYGWTAREAIGKVMPHVPPSRRRDAVSVVRRCASSSDEVLEREVVVRRKGGAHLTVRVVQVPLRDGDGLPAGLLSIARTVHSDSRVEVLKDQFLSSVSEGLRGPLAAVRGYVQLLGRPEIAEDTARRARTVRALEARVGEMTALVEDLLAVSGIEEQGLVLQLDAVDLPTLVTAAVIRCEQSESSRRFVLDVDTAIPDVVADARRVSAALGALMSNAVSRSTEGSEIAVSVVRDGDCAVVSVRHDGTGESASVPGDAFEPFQHRDGHPVSGLGLGLYLVRTIAEAHQGAVAISFAEGEGTEYRLRLPLAGPRGD